MRLAKKLLLAIVCMFTGAILAGWSIYKIIAIWQFINSL